MSICLNCGSDVAGADRCATCGAYTKVVTTAQDGTVSVGFTPPPRKLVRPRTGRIIAGVCAGIANRYGIPLALVRILFIFPGVFWLVGPITYVVLTLQLKEWPPTSLEPRHVELTDRSAEVRKAASSSAKSAIIAWCCIVIGALIGIARDRDLFILVLVVGVPVGVFYAIRWASQATRIAKEEAQRLPIQAVARRYCSQCEQVLDPGAVVCPICGCEKLLLSPEELQRAKQQVNRPSPQAKYPAGLYSVLVTDAGGNRWKAVTAMMRVTNLTPPEIRQYASQTAGDETSTRAPFVVARGISGEAAQQVQEILTSAGVSVEVRQGTACSGTNH